MGLMLLQDMPPSTYINTFDFGSSVCQHHVLIHEQRNSRKKEQSTSLSANSWSEKGHCSIFCMLLRATQIL